MNRLLLVDDDVELCEMLTRYLVNEGFGVEAVHEGSEVLGRLRNERYDLIVLDVMLPGRSGLDILRDLRARSLTPVLMLTARGEDVDSIVGLELGADDYLAKPCNPRVLVARIRAILRRAATRISDADGAGPETLSLNDVVVQTGSRTVTCQGSVVELTSTEYSVLEVLLREAGRVVPKTELSERALGRDFSAYDRSLDMHVSNLRRKLGLLPRGVERIKTVRGKGYLYTVQ